LVWRLFRLATRALTDNAFVNVKLHGAVIVEEVFGAWPTFHDAEITRITMSRVGPAVLLELLIPAPAPSLNALEGKDLPRHFLARLAFHECDDVSLEDFNHQNVISYLTLSHVNEQRIKVEIHSVFGATCSFTCSRGEVLDMTPTHLRTGRPLDPADGLGEKSFPF
jgi:hypothetical protein